MWIDALANNNNSKSLESWTWDAACSIRGAKDAPKYKDYILPLVFAKRLCDVFDDEIDRIAVELGSRKEALAQPRQDEQQKIVNALDSIEGKTQVALRKQAVLQDLFRTLIHQLMTAKPRVHDLELPIR